MSQVSPVYFKKLKSNFIKDFKLQLFQISRMKWDHFETGEIAQIEH